MTLTRFLGGAGLALLGGHQAAALLAREVAPPMAATEVAADRSCLPSGAYRQKLQNLQDLQYYGRMRLGSQEILGIIDTGSFELVVFSKNCKTCGTAAAFDEKSSSTFQFGNHSTVHSYGSGSCQSKDGWEEVHLACFGARSQAMWLATMCQMPALQMASFNAIVGVGPPGQPEYTARAQIDQLEQIEAQLKASGQPLPAELKDARGQLDAMLEDALSKPAMLDNFGMKTFSQCLGKEPGAPGFMVWNDVTRADRPGTKKIHVAGNITWGIQIEEMAFALPGGDSIPFGCKDGCGAVVDTGTSLMAVPTSSYQAAIQVLTEKFGAGKDCSDLSSFPELVVKINGHSFRLPPSSFLGTMEGSMRRETGKYMHLNSLTEPAGNETAAAPGGAITNEVAQSIVEAAKAAAQAAASAAAAAHDAAIAAQAAAEAAKAAAAAVGAKPAAPAEEPQGPNPKQCQLLMMDIGEQKTTLGPMLILGMPWFRQFYTTFDLGSGRGDRSIFVTPAGDDCDPDVEGPVSARRSTAFTPRHLDASKIRGPRWLDSLPEGQF